VVEARTAENLDLGGHEPGYEWVAGETPPNDPAPGKWLVRRLAGSWRVLFRSAPTGAEYKILDFSPDDSGEKAAKGMANKLVNNAWESYRNDPRRRNKDKEVIW
jgi:hypothetical protein